LHIKRVERVDFLADHVGVPASGGYLRRALVFVAILAGLIGLRGAHAADAVRLGVLAFRPVAETQARWQPLADYLNQALPERRFVLKAYKYPDLEAAIAARQVDFILTQPAHYVLMTYRNRLSSPLATLVENEGGKPLSVFGGVIFTQAGRADIATLTDLKGKTLATSAISSLGSYQMQAHELIHAGVRLPEDANVMETGQPQDRAVTAVLQGRADVGFVRTGVIESMVREGKLDASALKVVNSQVLGSFSDRLSTRLYPEWAFAAMPNIDGALARQVAAALLVLPHGEEVARAIGIQGFTIPADYHPVDDLLRELRLPPFDAMPDFSASDVWSRFRSWLAAGVMLWSLILLIVATRLWLSNRRLQAKRSELKQSMDRLADGEARQRAILHALGEGVCGTDGDGLCRFINATALAMLQMSENEALGQDLHGLLHHHRPDGQPYPISECPTCMTRQDGQTRHREEWFFRQDGTHFPVWLTVTPLNNAQPSLGIIVAFRDISANKAAETQLRKLSQAVEQSPVSIVITDVEGRIDYVNQFFLGNSGYTQEELVGQNPRILSSGETPAETYSAMWNTLKDGGTWQGEFINRRKDGSEFIEHAIIAPIRNPDGQIDHYLAVKQDITQRKAAEEEIRYLAFYDLLTHLPNRRLLVDRLQQALQATARSQRHGALLLIDLDNFKALNDTHGHGVGDRLLQQIAPLLAVCIREGDSVARLGGDEFVVMLENLSETRPEAAAQAMIVGEKIIAALHQTFHFGENEHYSSASLGVTLFCAYRERAEPTLSAAATALEALDEVVDTLLQQVDLAMYQAKAAGRNTLRLFDSAMQAVVTERATLETDLRQAVQEGQFLLYYQAQVDVGGRLTGAEALVRWQHPRRGMVSPLEFIPLAEETGVILPLGHWVLETACRQLAVWATHADRAHLSIAVNVSARQFRQTDFVAQVLAVIDATGANPARLKLELTESLLLDNVEDIIEKMRVLKAQGVGFSLDDFGTGYSSLSYLKRLPLDQLKIDQSFVRDLLTDANDAAIAQMIVALAQSMGLAVIAEGVETPAQRDLLASLGCYAYQGYLFGRPGPAAALQAVGG
jgi:diguanylate cyclase (GGDEF)-like protein/PAS domain S-box-containing protein